MRGNAIQRFFEDLGNGDPIAIALSIFFLSLLVIPLVIFIVDRRKKAREKHQKQQRASKIKRKEP